MTTVGTQQQAQAHNQSQERVEQFKQEIADMRLRDPNTARDRMLLRAGIALMVAGIAIAIVAYFISHTTTNTLLQNDMLITSVIGLSVTIAGAAVFVRYSMAQFMRFWLARLTFEQQHQTDRIVDAVTKH